MVFPSKISIRRIPFLFIASGASYRWLFIWGMITALAASCENDRQEIRELTQRSIGVEIADSVDIIYTLGDQTKSRITAPVMVRHDERNPYIEFPNTIHADFFDSTLTVESQMDALYAKYFESESKIFLRDSVVVYNNEGDTLFCRELYWDRNQVDHEFYTDKPIRIRTPTHYIDGDGLDAPQSFKSWHIVNGRGTVRVAASDWDELPPRDDFPDSTDSLHRPIPMSLPAPANETQSTSNESR